MSALGIGAAAAIAGASMLAGFLVGVYAAEKDRKAREDRFRARLEELDAGRGRARDTAVRLENELARNDETLELLDRLERGEGTVVAEVLDRPALERIAAGVDPVPRYTPPTRAPLGEVDDGMRAD